MLPSDCEAWLGSKSRINRAGSELAANPGSYTALRQVQCYRLFRASGFPTVFELTLPILSGVNTRVAGRLKRLPSIVRKMGRNSVVDLAQLVDLVGLRIICESLQDADRVCAALSDLEHHKKTINYVAEPRESGYRSRHCILKIEQTWPATSEIASFEVEVQVRTWWQHLWAQVSEGFGEQVKEGGGSTKIRSYLKELGSALAEVEEANPGARQVSFHGEGATQHILVSRRPSHGAEKVYSESFKTDYAKAMRRLVGWEEDLGASDYDVLLLVGIGSPKFLGQTHSIFFGAEKIPLPEWAPEPPT